MSSMSCASRPHTSRLCFSSLDVFRFSSSYIDCYGQFVTKIDLRRLRSSFGAVVLQAFRVLQPSTSLRFDVNRSRMLGRTMWMTYRHRGSSPGWIPKTPSKLGPVCTRTSAHCRATTAYWVRENHGRYLIDFGAIILDPVAHPVVVPRALMIGQSTGCGLVDARRYEVMNRALARSGGGCPIRGSRHACVRDVKSDCRWSGSRFRSEM